MKNKLFFNLILFVVLFVPPLAAAQTTEFTQQGTLPDPFANGTYDFEFRLFDAAAGGTAIVIRQRLGVSVTNGNYRVNLDFGNVFPGAARFLETGYKNIPGPFTTISPREPVTSAPYAVRSLSAVTADQVSNSCVGCVTNTNISQVAGSKITGQVPVTSIPAGSGSYVQNTTTQQAESNFNISGTGTANILNAATQYNINGYRFISAGTFDSGFGNFFNTFVGIEAGQNTNTNNAMGNSFFGFRSGKNNTNGSSNSFFGSGSGTNNSTGLSNSFFGNSTGSTNLTGDSNTLIGTLADVATGNLNYATAIGAGAVVSNSNSVVLGRADGSDAVRIPGAVIIKGSLVVDTLGSAGTATLCRNVANRISPCSSSLRYKTNINRFGLGLGLINQLKPITFDWKDGGMHDLGLGAEDVAAVEPLLVTYNPKGEVEGVKYDRIGVVLVNAVNEQQTEIEAQQKQISEQSEIIKRQQTELDALKTLVCSQNPTAEPCKPKN